jgi:hypothetical protein
VSVQAVPFADRLVEVVTRKRSQLVVGLDPLLDLLPMELRGESVLGRAAAASSVARFSKGIIDAVGPYVVAVKPQSAFFEALGSTACARSRSAPTRVPRAARLETRSGRHRLDVACVRGGVPRPRDDGVRSRTP